MLATYSGRLKQQFRSMRCRGTLKLMLWCTSHGNFAFSENGARTTPLLEKNTIKLLFRSGAVKRTSGVIATTQQEMALHVVRMQLAKMQSEYLPKKDAAAEEDDEEREEPDFHFQSFHTVPSLGSITLVPSLDDSMLWADGGAVIDYLHPLLETSELYSLIAQKAQEDMYVQDVFQGVMHENPDFAIRLFGAVKSDGDSKAGLEPWYLRANRRYQGNSRGKNTRAGIPVFNSYEIEYTEGLPGENYFVKVFALVGFQNSKEVARKRAVLRTDLWVAIARYKKVAKPRHAPFAQYSFEHQRGRLSIDLVPISSVKRPCFMCVSSDAPSNHRAETKHNYTSIVWSCIPFSTAVKVQNLALADVYNTLSEEEVDSAFASISVIDEVLEEYGLRGNHNHVLTEAQSRILLQAGLRSSSSFYMASHSLLSFFSDTAVTRRSDSDSESSSSESDSDEEDAGDD